MSLSPPIVSRPPRKPRTVPIARCGCSVYSCSGTDVTITRAGDVVHWDWSRAVPMKRGVSFPAAQYDAEIARVANDLSWETPVRIAGRLVLANVDREHLLGYGLRPAWTSDAPDGTLFQVALEIEDDYQVFVNTPWRGRSPEELARTVCHTLAGPPHAWQATWHAVNSTVTEPPTIAGPSWRHEQL